ncbi:GNAT family N-acetyltransferase [Brevibacterium luteolum]|uniref:N-acetyltransferase n=1 Tax=Brevibacterium luteolum TaxID=199591 RepID=A0A6G8KVD1_9MICO|nr:GNAT family N-acetyltransferase [Brevibacterium luteolum]QIN28784.1 N-acetyltransferase [Brevibacterium luteolum]
MKPPPSTASSVGLRRLRIDDAHEMTTVLADPALYTFTGGQPPAEDDLEKRFAIKAPGRSPSGAEIWLNYIVTLGTEQLAVGYVQATIPADTATADVAWAIGTQWQGRGIATGAMTQFLDVLRDHRITELIAHIHPDHIASQRVAECLGMTRTSEIVDGEESWSAALHPQM